MKRATCTVLAVVLVAAIAALVFALKTLDDGARWTLVAGLVIFLAWIAKEWRKNGR